MEASLEANAALLLVGVLAVGGLLIFAYVLCWRQERAERRRSTRSKKRIRFDEAPLGNETSQMNRD